MKGFSAIAALVLGVCIIIAAGIVVGAVTFPQAIHMTWTMLIWIVAGTLIFLGIIFAIIIIVAWASK
jgi:hypothetical protein